MTDTLNIKVKRISNGYLHISPDIGWEQYYPTVEKLMETLKSRIEKLI